MERDIQRQLRRQICLDPASPGALARLVEAPGIAQDKALSTALSRLPLVDPGLDALATEAPLRCSVFGANFDLRAMRGDQLAKRIAQYGMYERHISAFFRQRLRPGHVFFDVGANVGYHSLLVAQSVGPGGRVVAFEPHPAIRRILARNVADNRLTNVTVDPRAIGLAAGSAQVEFDLLDSGATAVSLEGRIGWQSSDVTVTTLDQACSDHQVVPHVMKIDAEGLEADILMGGRRLFTEHNPTVIMEYCPENNSRARTRFATALGWLRDVGYHACFFRGHDFAAYEPMPMDMLIQLGEHWLAREHVGFVDVLLIKAPYAKKRPPAG